MRFFIRKLNAFWKHLMDHNSDTTDEEPLSSDAESEHSAPEECVNPIRNQPVSAEIDETNDKHYMGANVQNELVTEDKSPTFKEIDSQIADEKDLTLKKKGRLETDKKQVTTDVGCALQNVRCESMTVDFSTGCSDNQNTCSSVTSSEQGSDKRHFSSVVESEQTSAYLNFTLSAVNECAAYELCLSLSVEGDHLASNVEDIETTYEEGSVPNGESCKVCYKIFSSKGNLKQHNLIHSEVKPFVCDVCDKGFVLRRALQQHYYLHTGERPYVCHFCSKGYMKKISLEKHFLMQHGEYGSDGSNVCLQGTVKHPHIGPYVCKVCDEKFIQKRQLKKHLLLHTGGRYYCDICNRSYKQNYILDRHLLTHTGVRPYVCDVCSKSFMQKSVLKTHYLTHTDAKPHVCDICNKGFSLKHYLQLHILSHSGAKPHVCSVCKKMFREKRVLKRHSLIHTGEKPFVCMVCKKAFCEKRSLQKHSLREHSTDLI